jgi:hypothetical protein
MSSFTIHKMMTMKRGFQLWGRDDAIGWFSFKFSSRHGIK